MRKPTSRKERVEHRFNVPTSQRFLTKHGRGNEMPFFICPHPAKEGLPMVEDRLDLVIRIAHSGIAVLDLTLYDLSLDILEERGILDQILKIEPETDKGEIRELMQSMRYPKANLIPRIGDAIQAASHDVIFLSGVGKAYPYIRSHNVLNNRQSTATDKPTVLFFAGCYTLALSTGASLGLFGRFHDETTITPCIL